MRFIIGYGLGIFICAIFFGLTTIPNKRYYEVCFELAKKQYKDKNLISLASTFEGCRIMVNNLKENN